MGQGCAHIYRFEFPQMGEIVPKQRAFAGFSTTGCMQEFSGTKLAETCARYNYDGFLIMHFHAYDYHRLQTIGGCRPTLPMKSIRPAVWLQGP
jgi:hypothetical protein